MIDFVKTKINWKKRIYKTYIKNGCIDINYHELNYATKFVTEIVNKRKQEYYDQPVNNPKMSTKTCETFYNGKPLIPPF